MDVKEPQSSTRQSAQPAQTGLPRPLSTDHQAELLAHVSRDLLDQRDEVPTLQRVTQSALEVVSASDHCGIFLRRRRHEVEAVAPSSEVARTCDAVQHDVGEGPCLDALWEDEVCLVEDTTTETRWPVWAPRVAAQGIGSVLSIRLGTGSEIIGSLNLYAERPHAFTDDDVDLALLYAMHAGGALSAALMVDSLHHAIQSRHTIGVAQGILMHRYELTLAQAFEVLRRYSSHSNIKLREVAESVVQNGGLPESPAGGLPETPAD